MKKIIVFLVLSILIVFFIHNTYYRPPYFYSALINFHLKETSLIQVRDFMMANKEVHKLSMIPDSNLTEVSNENRAVIVFDKETRKNLYKSMFEIETWYIKKIDNGLLYDLGTDEKFNRRFGISYIFHSNVNIDLPQCNTEIDYEKRGVCTFKIEDNWLLLYEWRPIIPEIIIEQKTPWPPKKLI